jgi:hypothetical protein
MRLWVGQPDWGKFEIPDNDAWNERVAPGRYIFHIELVDEGRARMLTLRRSTTHAKPPAVDPWDFLLACNRCGRILADWFPITTAMYVDVRDLPLPVLERMHP